MEVLDLLPAGVADRGVFDQGEKLIIYCNSSKERAFQKEKKKNYCTFVLF